MKKTIVTKSLEETQDFARNMAQELSGGEVLLLFGDLGAGKTTFIQGLAEGLGITQRIISPTFLIMRSYIIPFSFSSPQSLSFPRKRESIQRIGSPIKPGMTTLYHLDLYRINSEDDLEGLGIREILDDKNSIVAIEWPEKLGHFLPKKRIELHFTNFSEKERKITVIKVQC